MTAPMSGIVVFPIPLKIRPTHFQESRKSKAIDSILPRVALYAVLLEEGHLADRIMTTYNEKYAGAAMHNKYAKMEKIPGFFGIFRRIFISFTNKSEFWDCRLQKISDGLS